jgi:hypothetical protein
LTRVPAGIRRGCHHHRVAGDRVRLPTRSRLDLDSDSKIAERFGELAAEEKITALLPLESGA